LAKITGGAAQFLVVGQHSHHKQNMDNQKFLGICLVVAAVIIAGAIYLHDSRSRYQFQPSNPPGVIYVFDTWTGEVKTH
jgi:hypothetical protein